MRVLVGDLRSVAVPVAFAAANRDVVSALDVEVQGLVDRDLAIAKDSDIVFGRAIGELKSAAVRLVAAYNEFPSGDRPMPAEFGQGQED